MIGIWWYSEGIADSRIEILKTKLHFDIVFSILLLGPDLPENVLVAMSPSIVAQLIKDAESDAGGSLDIADAPLLAAALQLLGSYTLTNTASATGWLSYKKSSADPSMPDQYLYHYEDANKAKSWVISGQLGQPGTLYVRSRFDHPNPGARTLRWGQFNGGEMYQKLNGQLDGYIPECVMRCADEEGKSQDECADKCMFTVLPEDKGEQRILNISFIFILDPQFA